MSIAQKLALLHSSYRVYPSESLQPKPGNILTELQKYPAFDYLTTFYNEYCNNYPPVVATAMNDKRARSRDLFFIGEETIKAEASKFFFVFEGALSDTQNLSITVLSHLWLLQNDDPIIKEFCDKWWRLSDYRNIKDKLKICKDFANDSYIVDALRLDDSDNSVKRKINQKLIYEEIHILKPKLVICVGKTAQDIVGMKYLDQDTKFHSVRFPKYHSEVDGYEELSKIMERL